METTLPKLTGAATAHTVVVVGLSGNGKSALCNRLHGGRNVFSESDGVDSETLATECRMGLFRVANNSLPLQVVDTPGLGDRDNRDSKHVKQMVDVIRNLKGVNAFLLVFNYQNPRINANTIRLVQLLQEILPGRNIWTNVIVVFTKVYRPKASSAEVATRLADFKQQFKIQFSANLLDIQFAFADSKDGCGINTYNINNADNLEQFRNMFEFVRNAKAFPIGDARAVEGGLDFQKLAKLQELERQAALEKEKARREREQQVRDRQQREEEARRQHEEQQRQLLEQRKVRENDRIREEREEQERKRLEAQRLQLQRQEQERRELLWQQQLQPICRPRRLVIVGDPAGGLFGPFGPFIVGHQPLFFGGLHRFF